MLKFLKENGFAADLIFETKRIEPMSENSFVKYESVVSANGKVIETFCHREFTSARGKYAQGFFRGIEFANEN